MQALAGTVSPWRERTERAAALAAELPWTAEILAFYGQLADRQRQVAERSEAASIAPSELSAWVAAEALPVVVDVAVNRGPEVLAHSVLARFHDADLEQLVAKWLAGDQQDPIDTFLARAATAPVLEALPALARATGRPAVDDRHCPACGGPPQLSYFGISGEALVTAPRHLLCSRCSASWVFPRLVCAGCGETDAPRLSVLSDPDRLPGLRLDACETCRSYLVTVELPKRPRAVPVVDEMAALPLDLHAKERGLTKVTPNLVGF